MTTVSKSVPAHKTRLWVVCCEETEAATQVFEAVEEWQLPAVRSLFTQSLLTHRTPAQRPLSETVAASDYAIFVTPYNQPSSQVRVSPLDVTHPNKVDEHSPAALLGAIHNRHGQSPQSWWLQMPTIEMRAHRMQSVSIKESVAQSLHQIGIFVRNYQLALVPTTINNLHKKPARKVIAPQQQVTLSHYRRI